jgi:hypothetical protein
MIISDRYYDALDLLYAFGDSLFETVERASRLDAGLIVPIDRQPNETETRAVVIENFAPSDPENDIDDAIRAWSNEEEERLERHGLSNGKLCCPICAVTRERLELPIYDSIPGRRLKAQGFCLGLCRLPSRS